MARFPYTRIASSDIILPDKDSKYSIELLHELACLINDKEV